MGDLTLSLRQQCSTKTTTFSFAGLELRCVTIEGRPWFVAEDVCRMIGLTNPTVSLRSLDPHQQAKKFLGHPKAVNIISESGLYALVMRAQKANPKAREFQSWVTGTVLPAIRQTGGYIQGEEKLDPNNDPPQRSPSRSMRSKGNLGFSIRTSRRRWAWPAPPIFGSRLRRAERRWRSSDHCT